jgi:hypothetical protein
VSRLHRKIPVLLVLSVAALAALAGSARACPCQEFCGQVAAHGSSLYGVPWRITANQRPITPHSKQLPTGELNFSIGDCGAPNEVERAPGIEVGSVGWSTGILLPLSSRFGLSVGSGSEVDPYPESDLSGFVTRRATTLLVAMSEGAPLVIRPRLAPAELRRRWPWLGRLRLFDAFFPAGPVPLHVAACDRDGNLLAGANSKLGSFDAQLRAAPTSPGPCQVATGGTG